MTKQYSRALEILEEILVKHPFHLTSKKRKAVLLEKVFFCHKKMGKINERKAEFEKCLYL